MLRVECGLIDFGSMDAISFVLGIKSSHLRSTHLRDLVYRGRVLRTSIINADGTATEAATDAQANGHGKGDANGADASHEEVLHDAGQRHDPQTAWVMAVYEDEAGEEQKWKRSITNSGQSEYRINNRVVGAKQYNDALEAENILIKARNFLVFQGDVEAIASQSAKDLTRLVEQISGSLEYKADYERLKVEAEKAEEDQYLKLNQRRSLNAEVKQYQELKREADNYAKKVDQRDEAIVNQVLWKLYHLQRVMEESGAEIEKYQEELKEYRRGVEKHETRLEEAKKEQAKVGREVGKTERSIRRKEKEVEQKENSLVPIDEKIVISEKALKKYETRINEISKERDGQLRNPNQLKKDLALVQKAEKKWNDEWKELTKRKGIELSQSDMQEYNRLRAEVNRRTAADQIKVDDLTRQERTDEETLNSLKSTVESSEAQILKLQEEIQDAVERTDAINNQAKHIGKDIESKKKALNSLASERLRTAQKQTEMDEKLQGILNKLIEADDGRRQSERDVRSREVVAAMKRIFPGVRGRIHELCKPKQKKFDTAVSTVLGRHFEAVVVDTEKTAKECIQYLRDQRVGQATFIPLDTIQVKAVNSNLKGMHPAMRLAIDTIEYDNSVERAMSYVCGNDIICDDLATAKYICYEKGVEAKAVTLDGTVIHKGGLMTGGRGPSDRNSKKWEDNELENLRKLRDNLLNDLAALPKGRSKAAEEETLQGELAGLDQRLIYAKEEVNALEKNLESKRKELNFTKSQLKEARPKYQSKTDTLNSLKETLMQYRDAISQVEDAVFADYCRRLKFDNIRVYEAQHGSIEQEAAQKRLEFTMQRSKLENQLSFETQRLQSTQDRIKTLHDQSKRDETLIADLRAEKETIQEELDGLNPELEQLTEQLGRHKESYAQKSEKVTELRHEVEKRSKHVESALRTITGLEAELQRSAASRYALLRKCKIEEIEVPLKEGSEPLDSLPANDLVPSDPDAMDVDGDPDSTNAQPAAVQSYGIDVDFDELAEDLMEVSFHISSFRLERYIDSLR